MMARIKAYLQLARVHVWAVLLALYPFADQIIAGVEGWMPALSPYLGASVYRYTGLAIVVAKVVLQVYRGWLQFNAVLTRKVGGA